MNTDLKKKKKKVGDQCKSVHIFASKSYINGNSEDSLKSIEALAGFPVDSPVIFFIKFCCY